jgi:hypothetical protein
LNRQESGVQGLLFVDAPREDMREDFSAARRKGKGKEKAEYIHLDSDQDKDIAAGTAQHHNVAGPSNSMPDMVLPNTAIAPTSALVSSQNLVEAGVVQTGQPQPRKTVKGTTTKPSAVPVGAPSIQEPLGAAQTGAVNDIQNAPQVGDTHPVKKMPSRHKVQAKKPNPLSPAGAAKTRESRRRYLEWLSDDKEYVVLLNVFKNMVCRCLLIVMCF